ncbi:Omega-amidase YafV [Arenibacter antarcticus]|uniref:Amidohydrolase n=1 Tax=Arenibacter antarcticus TaxID=2040469 RepID=A0ABW5VL28_9FLAO|nr:amidohydrolase [Arenibacter sp. H213]MCM4166730.1 amidohydrolase [Arenibacter sp. H213]
MSTELHIALVQCPLVWEDPVANRENLERIILSLSSSIDLIVLPEMFTTGFTMTPANIAREEGEKTVEWMQAMATLKNAALVGSIVFAEGEHYYNRLWFVEPDNKIASYNKRHTFTLAGEDKVYTAGENRLLINFRGFRIFPLICYDLRFPVWARNTEGYDVLIYVANWPEKRIAAWDALLKARAIENMAYVIGVNRVGTDNYGHEYVGHSAVYDVLGNTLVCSKVATVLYATLDKEHIETQREKLRFLEDRDQFSLQV